MSINSLANAAAARHRDLAPFLNTVPKTYGEIAQASSTPPTKVSNLNVQGGQQRTSPAPTDTAFNVLFGYIPTEIVTLYVAVIAVLPQDENGISVSWITFWFFLLATPVVFLLVYAGKLKSAEKSHTLNPLKLNSWPLWEMFAAILAYITWTFALPNSPFAGYPWYSSGVSGLAVLVVSTLLGLMAPFFQKQLAS